MQKRKPQKLPTAEKIERFKFVIKQINCGTPYSRALLNGGKR